MKEEGSSELSKLEKAVQFLHKTFGPAPGAAAVMGSGLSGFADELDRPYSVQTEEIPGGIASSVAGHHGRLVVGFAGENRVAILAGRVHGYEGHSPQEVAFLVRALFLWGIRRFVITNAAGSTHRAFPPGSLVLIKDQINFTGKNPLVGLELYGGDRFPDMSDIYSNTWRRTAKRLAQKVKVPVKEGVYIGVLGPTYETKSEVIAYRKLGADIVGMSTVWETIALKQMGAEILGISTVTNYGTGILKTPLRHEDVLAVTQKVKAKFGKLLLKILSE